MRANRDLCEIAGMIALSENAREVTLDHFHRAVGRMHRTDVRATAGRPLALRS